MLIFTVPWHLPAMKHHKTVAKFSSKRERSRDRKIDINFLDLIFMLFFFFGHFSINSPYEILMAYFEKNPGVLICIKF